MHVFIEPDAALPESYYRATAKACSFSHRILAREMGNDTHKMTGQDVFAKFSPE